MLAYQSTQEKSSYQEAEFYIYVYVFRIFSKAFSGFICNFLTQAGHQT